MNNQATIEKMKQMRLSAMAQTYYNSVQNNMHQDYTLDQYVALLIDQPVGMPLQQAHPKPDHHGRVQVSGIGSGCRLYCKPFFGSKHL